jgi:hypothetical protein
MENTDKEGVGVGVRLLVYSGRPDPEWTLEPGEAKELLEMLGAVVGAEEIHPPPAGGLGYRGFLITNAPVGKRPGEVAVFRGVITERPGRQAAHWRDVRGVERWLLDQARRQGHGAALEGSGEDPGEEV